MKIIGIITHKSKSIENHNINYVYNDIAQSIKINGGIPIGIILEEDYKELIDFCDGIIFQGGDDFERYDLLAISYAHKIDKPVLGICLGMQLMGKLFNSSIIDVEGHKNTIHDVYINKNSKLYGIFNEDILSVNSRHKSVIINPETIVSATSRDGYIEAIEDPNKRFFIGVQWHPESFKKDSLQNKLFSSFINCIEEKNP